MRPRAPSIVAIALASMCAWATERASTTVGMPAVLEELVLPGTELELAPAAPDAPLVVRIVATSAHGGAFRYDFEYWALEAGEYDLRAALRRKDGTSAADLPPIPVSVRATMPAGMERPHAPRGAEVPAFGGYRALLWTAGAVWIVGLAALFLWKRGRRSDSAVIEARPLTLAERLRPLVESARDGTLSREERARLELSLFAYWRRKLGLDDARPYDALKTLRAHDEAGPLFQSLDDWLHRPDSSRGVDVAALLAPYRDLPADALERNV